MRHRSNKHSTPAHRKRSPSKTRRETPGSAPKGPPRPEHPKPHKVIISSTPGPKEKLRRPVFQSGRSAPTRRAAIRGTPPRHVRQDDCQATPQYERRAPRQLRIPWRRHATNKQLKTLPYVLTASATTWQRGLRKRMLSNFSHSLFSHVTRQGTQAKPERVDCCDTPNSVQAPAWIMFHFDHWSANVLLLVAVCRFYSLKCVCKQHHITLPHVFTKAVVRVNPRVPASRIMFKDPSVLRRTLCCSCETFERS